MYIDFIILLIPTPLVSVLFCSSIPTFVHFFFNVLRSLYVYIFPHNYLSLLLLYLQQHPYFLLNFTFW